MLRRQIDEVHTVELQGIQGTLALGGTRAARKGQSRRAPWKYLRYPGVSSCLETLSCRRTRALQGAYKPGTTGSLRNNTSPRCAARSSATVIVHVMPPERNS